METASKYNPSDVEAKWYGYWIEHKLFASKPDGREPYTIVIPPPNVTGVLHMGHLRGFLSERENHLCPHTEQVLTVGSSFQR